MGISRIPNPTITDWTAFTPTSTWTTNTTWTGYYQIVGSTMNVLANGVLSGAPNTATLLLYINATGYAINTAIFSALTSYVPVVGQCLVYDNGGSKYPGPVEYVDANTVVARTINASGSYGTAVPVTQAAPITIGASDEVHINITVPVVKI